MASAKQIAWRKKFGRMAKAGKFKKSKLSKKEKSVLDAGAKALTLAEKDDKEANQAVLYYVSKWKKQFTDREIKEYLHLYP